MKRAYFIGIDIGTQGARVALVDSEGNVVASIEETFPLDNQSLQEQSPEGWWEVCRNSLKQLVSDAKKLIVLSDIKAVAVTSTSGTVIPLDAQNEPLHPAIMYSDKRSATIAKMVREKALQHHPKGYTGFNASSGLSKMVWFVTEFPEKAQAISKWVHAADFITGMLSGCWGITDVTNVLKSGYDLNEKTWPPFLYEELPLKKEWLPTVVASGTPIGQLLPALAAELGLSSAVKVVAGMTDGCASQIASGAVNLGEWNTTIGTTLVVKGVTRQQLIDPEDRLYSHLHPEGYWMPGGASNTGADWITKEFKDDLARLNEAAKALIPTNFMAYPLRQEGERFPFVSPQARGFEPEGLSTEERFAANMEGVAYIERYAYEMIEELSGEKVKAVYTAGGGSNSDVWLQIRSNVLNLPIVKMKHVTGAVGAAILAASKTHFTSVIDAAHAMTQVEKEVYPQKNFVAIYKRNYRQFKEQLQEKGYIAKEQFA